METVVRTYIEKDWMTVLFVACLMLTVAAKVVGNLRFQYFQSLFVSNKYLLIFGKEQKNLITNWFNIILFTVQVISYSLFAYLLIQEFGKEQLSKDPYLYLKIASLLSFFVFLKFTLEKIFANIVDIEPTVDNYNFQKLSYRNLTGLFILPLLFIAIYARLNVAFVLYLTIAVFIFLNLIALYNTIKNHQKLILGNLFYFILYLCALEIAPYFIIYKIVF